MAPARAAIPGDEMPSSFVTRTRRRRDAVTSGPLRRGPVRAGPESAAEGSGLVVAGAQVVARGRGQGRAGKDHQAWSWRLRYPERHGGEPPGGVDARPDGYGTSMDRAAALRRVRDEATTCTSCDLYRNATQMVFGEGRPS